MDFVRSKLGTNEPLPVEHYFPHFLADLQISVQLLEVHLYRSYFLQNPYFRYVTTANLDSAIFPIPKVSIMQGRAVYIFSVF